MADDYCKVVLLIGGHGIVRPADGDIVPPVKMRRRHRHDFSVGVDMEVDGVGTAELDGSCARKLFTGDGDESTAFDGAC